MTTGPAGATQIRLAERVIAIGASAGGGAALRQVLRPLPADFPHAILVVQHLAAGGSALMADLLDGEIALEVREARPGQPVRPACAYLAPAGYHLLVERDRHLALSVDPHVCFCRPSIDVLFETAAAAYREALTAVVLTGANHDGAAGLVQARERGALAIVQDPAEAEFAAMPAAALEQLARDPRSARLVLRLSQIADLLLRLGRDPQAGGALELS